ncbi:hypothetical protein SEPCBS57363_000561 [Sporothrix epigloea]|uniref:Glycosyltransferase family 28 N-terminal domain-containing protein n=1 Tax=Sporothrix epigloea TaxID=1892477 RepID=A0ABP0D6F9_9PEZI
MAENEEREPASSQAAEPEAARVQTQQTQRVRQSQQEQAQNQIQNTPRANSSISNMSPNLSTATSQASTASTADRHSHPHHNHHQHQHHSTLRRGQERFLGIKPDDSEIHYKDINREGLDATVALDKEGRLAYPSLVPPAIESPRGPNDDDTDDFFKSASASNLAPISPSKSVQQPERTSSEGRPRATSRPPNFTHSASAGPGSLNHADLLVTAPAAEPSVPNTSSAIEKTKNNEAASAVKGVTNLRPSQNRSSTTPMPMLAERRHSSISLIQELRRTSELHWDLPGITDDSDQDRDEDRSRSAQYADEVAPNPESSTAGSRGRRLSERQQNASGVADSSPSSKAVAGQSGETKASAKASFFKRSKKPKVFDHHSSLPFLSSQSYKRDGRLSISVKDTSHTGLLAKAVGAAVRRIAPTDGVDDEIRSSTDDYEGGEADADAYAPGTRKEELSVSAAEFGRVSRTLAQKEKPRLNIVIMVIGSRGDIQPFLKIGRVLKEKFGHRVRVATHPAFRKFIEEDAGLEFFSAGGDPAELMAFMVKNPGMIPSLSSMRSGDIGRRRDAMAEMFDGFWRACVNATDDPNDIQNLSLLGDKEPFIADAIIANPPSYVHVHCAEALGIPLHIMFTFPYTPTQAFPHPLANVKKSNVDPGYTNFISYPLIDMMVWQGLGDLVNNFRVNTLDLEPISLLWAPSAIYRMHVPFTYLWSPGLIPKPSDWGPEIDVGGFVFLELASSFKPPASLEKFLAESEEPPIYIGFGSIVVDDADKFTEMIFEAVRKSGVRALVSKGWGGFGGKGDSLPDNIYMLENTPHDWLFPKVRAVVIHGGAGTTAIALKCGLPIMVVPFFGDQYFWGSMIEKSKVGPKPVPYKHLTAERLADGIKYLLCDEARTAAQAIAKSIEKEGDGAENACRSFMRTLELEGHGSMRCSIFPEYVAVWQRKGSNIKLSALAAEALVQKGYMTYKDLRLLRQTEWNDFEGPGEPITAMFGSLTRSFRDVVRGPFTATKDIIRGGKNRRKERKEKKAQKKALAAKKKISSSSESGGPQDMPDENTLEGSDESSITLRDSGKAENGSFEVVFAAVGKSIGRSARALAMAPLDLYFSLCQGFHNAPRLYGDDTVRRTPHVTGVKSGMKAAGCEFVLGIYDGVTGIVRLPIRCARNGGGVHGFIRGAGMGLMGFVLKDISAIIGPLGYALKGIANQAKRSKQPARYLRRARMMQAQRGARALCPQSWNILCEKAIAGWEAMHDLYKVVQQGGQGGSSAPGGSNLGAGGSDESTMVAPKRTRTLRRGSIDSVFEHHFHHGISSSARQDLGDLDAALESADLAAIALAALRHGESLNSVVRGRHSYPRVRRQHPCHQCGTSERDLNMACRKQLAQRQLFKNGDDESEDATDDDYGRGLNDKEKQAQRMSLTNRPVEREFEKLKKLEELETSRKVVGQPTGENAAAVVA